MLSPLRKRAGRRLREPFGKAGLTVAVIALVFAMLGGAYAAGKLTSKQKKEVEKIAKKFQGTGPAGAQGPAGPKGDTGAQGPKGDTGATGPQGPQGLKGATGAPGKDGEDGEPWTAGGTLPPGAMETGDWAVSGIYPVLSQVFAPISFTVPLSEADAAVISEEPEPFSFPNIHVLAVGEDETVDCPGTAGRPEAAPGNLCIYSTVRSGYQLNGVSPVTATELATAEPEKSGVDTSGAIIFGYRQFVGGEGPVKGVGTWAVRAPSGE